MRIPGDDLTLDDIYTSLIMRPDSSAIVDQRIRYYANALLYGT